MNKDLRNSLETIALEFINHTSRNIFLTGGAGTGKTTFLRFLKKNTHKKVIVAAPTGVAAINAGGTTIHSLFGLPPRPLDNTAISNVRIAAQSRLVLRELEMLVIDEASMLRADVLDAIDYLLQDVRQDSRPLGGLQIVFIGDLYQLPPIETRQDNEKLHLVYQSLYFTNAKAFPRLQMIMIELHEVHRQSEPSFINLLSNIRKASLSDNDLNTLNRLYSPDWSKKEEVILTTHNRYASDINEQQLNSLPGNAHTLIAEISGEFSLDQLPVNNILQLKVGCRVMVIKNDNSVNRQFFNGKIGLVSAINDQAVEVKFDDGTTVTFNREIWSNIEYRMNGEDDSLKEIVVGTFKQFPLKLAWAITVHKSQGLTFEKAVIDVADAFAPGQVYVALSRIRTLTGVSLKSKIPGTAIIKPPVTETMFVSDPDISKLEMTLGEDKRAYMNDFIVKRFQWDHLSSTIEDKSSTKPILNDLRKALERLQGFASTFSQKLVEQINNAENPDWATLSNRLIQAENYFTKEINLTCIGPLKNFIKKYKDDFKFRGDVNLMKSYVKLFQDKISSIALASKVAKTVAVGITYLPLKKELSPLSPATPIKAVSEKLHNSVPSWTEAQSLALFLAGKSVSEIAAARALGIPAIESHLASYLPTGEVNLTDIVSKEILNEILPLVKDMKSPSIAQLRMTLGGKLSMGQLQALKTFLKNST